MSMALDQKFCFYEDKAILNSRQNYPTQEVIDLNMVRYKKKSNVKDKKKTSFTCFCLPNSPQLERFITLKRESVLLPVPRNPNDAILTDEERRVLYHW
jgi:hypothetical protein